MINYVRIVGTVYSGPYFNHTICNEELYIVYISSRRKSGYEDIIPVHILGRLLDPNIAPGQRVELEGSYRSYSFRKSSSQTGNKLYVYTNALIPTDSPEDKNSIIIDGYICKSPVYRNTFSGKQITDTTLAVYRNNKINYIPIISWGRNAEEIAWYQEGEYLKVSGRIQSREYQKLVDGSAVDKIAYEVSVSFIHRAKGCEEYEELKA